MARRCGRGVRGVRSEEPCGAGRAQPAHRRGGVDTGLDGALVQGGPGAEGQGEPRTGLTGLGCGPVLCMR